MGSILDQKYTTHVGDHQYIKNLDKVWSSPYLKKLAGMGRTYDAKNTLILDTDEQSVCLCKENALVIDKYERRDVWHSPTDPEPKRDQLEILNSIQGDLLNLLDYRFTDVREFLQKNCSDSLNVSFE